MVNAKAKRARRSQDAQEANTGDGNVAGSSTSGHSSSTVHLLSLPDALLEHVLSRTDARTLASLNHCCKAFRVFERSSGLRLVDKIARDTLTLACGERLARRWRNLGWLERLHVEDSVAGFDQQRCEPHGFRFEAPPPNSTPGAIQHLKLEGMGPKLLVSDLSTAEQPLLRWRMCVRGNTAVEFGVVPLSLQDAHKALHKCTQAISDTDGERPVGFCSSITVGSQLTFKVPVMKGSVVEVLACRGRVQFLVEHPPNGQELYWLNTRTVPKPYKGPREVRFEQDFGDGHDVKLALTCWAYGSFDVLTARASGPDGAAAVAEAAAEAEAAAAARAGTAAEAEAATDTAVAEAGRASVVGPATTHSPAPAGTMPPGSPLSDTSISTPITLH